MESIAKNSTLKLEDPKNMGEVTPEHIEAWKQKHGELQQIDIEGYGAILKSPERKDISYASIASQKDNLKFNQVVLERCWVFGDKEILNNTGLFLSASSKMDEIIGIKNVTLKKL